MAVFPWHLLREETQWSHALWWFFTVGFKHSVRSVGLIEVTIAMSSSTVSLSCPGDNIHSSLACHLALTFSLTSLLWCSSSLRRRFGTDLPFRSSIQLSLVLSPLTVISLCISPLLTNEACLVNVFCYVFKFGTFITIKPTAGKSISDQGSGQY